MKIYDDLYSAIVKIDPENHLNWWSKNRGVGMEMIVSSFCVRFCIL